MAIRGCTTEPSGWPGGSKWWGRAAAVVALAAAALSARDALALGARPGAPGEPAAPVAASPGGEVRTTGGAWTPIAQGDRVPNHRELRAAGRPLVVRAGDATIELGAGAAALLQGRMEILAPGGRTSALHVVLRTGEARVSVPAGSSEQVLFASGDNFALARPGSKLRVARAPTAPSALDVALYDGEALYSAAGTWRPLARGQVRTLATPSPSTTRPLLPPPGWLPDEPGAASGAFAVVAGKAGGAPLRLRVAPVSGAAGYVVELARTPAFDEVVARCEAGKAGVLDTPPLAAGSYVARAMAKDEGGMPGLGGPPRRLRVLRLELPAGGSAEGRVLTLPVGSPAVLDDPAGIEVRREMSSFAAAPGELALDDDRPMRLVLRMKGEGGTVPITLVPRALRAEVDIGPKTAEWPFDPVDVAVRVQGQSTPSFEPVLKVRVNHEQVPVAWTREGNTWRTRLEPRMPPGPWVVRVEAAEPDGAPLGRGFLEVVAPSRRAR
jgi:hypothetical protein